MKTRDNHGLGRLFIFFLDFNQNMVQRKTGCLDAAGVCIGPVFLRCQATQLAGCSSRTCVCPEVTVSKQGDNCNLPKVFARCSSRVLSQAHLQYLSQIGWTYTGWNPLRSMICCIRSNAGLVSHCPLQAHCECTDSQVPFRPIDLRVPDRRVPVTYNL